MKRSKDLRVPVFAALFAALSIVLGKYLALNIGDSIRFSLENLPVILASITLGPLWGAAVGVCADLLGSVMKGYAIIPLITVVQGAMGLLPGIFTKYIFRGTSPKAGATSVGLSHVICSMGLKTVALHIAYSQPLPVLFAARIPTYIVVGAVEAYICALLLKSSAIRKEFSL